MRTCRRNREFGVNGLGTSPWTPVLRRRSTLFPWALRAGRIALANAKIAPRRPPGPTPSIPPRPCPCRDRAGPRGRPGHTGAPARRARRPRRTAPRPPPAPRRPSVAKASGPGRTAPTPADVYIWTHPFARTRGHKYNNHSGRSGEMTDARRGAGAIGL